MEPAEINQVSLLQHSFQGFVVSDILLGQSSQSDNIFEHPFDIGTTKWF